jgi:HK97 family phage major capsid protein
MDIKELRQKKADLVREGRIVLSNLGLSAEQVDLQYKAIETQIEQTNASIARWETQVAFENKAGSRPDENVIVDQHQRVQSINDLGSTPFKSFGDQLHAVMYASRNPGAIDPRLRYQAAATGASEGIPSDGGFLVQKDFSTELIKRAYETGLLVSRCTKIPISGNSNGLKMNAVDETSRANGSRWGGIQAYWVNEADTTTATKPKFRTMELNLQKLLGLCYATDELLADGAALEAVISQGFAEEFGFKLDDAILNGTGAGQPLGILNSGAVLSVNKESGQSAATFLYDNVVAMWARLWARSRANAVWLYNQDMEPQIFKMSLVVGTGGVPVFMPASGASVLPYGTLFGRPMIPIEQAQTLGTVGDIMLADLSQYLLIDKGSMKSEASVHVRFINDETTFRFVYRVDGQPTWKSPITPKNGSNTQSPFVVLQTRS